jgi:prolyl-tRNA synthetase
VLLRMSSLFLRTLREDPADAEVPSHRLLVRGGYIRRAAPGGYTWLPLGWRVYRNVERIVREEMDAMGAQEVQFPALLPKEPYELSNRWTEYGDDIFRLKDRKGNDFLLAPTHEEMFTLLVKDLYSSYKDLPLWIYQIQTKFRDETRPRAGLLRGREFVMKDSYSFDVDDAGLDASYDAHREAYIRIFDRLGLEHVIVFAMSGAMGGSRSEEFLTPADNGEDTPDTPTIETLVALANAREDLRRSDRDWTAADTLKNVVVKLRHPGAKDEVIGIGVPGDREIDLKRLGAQVHPALVEAFTEADFADHPGLVRGYIGPAALGADKPAGVRYLLDPRIVEGTRWITGANESGRHIFDLVAGRDFSGDGTVEAAEVREDDTCPNCGNATLVLARGIEMGHIFSLGRKFADALDLKVLNEHGKQVVVTMGSYGIGVSRAVAAIAESTLDDIGLCWPRAVAPADVHLVATGKDDSVFEAAQSLADDLVARGVTILYDDRRGVSPGVKFKDAELLGMPTIVVVGRGLADGVVEVRDRKSGEREDVPVADAATRIMAAVRS